MTELLHFSSLKIPWNEPDHANSYFDNVSPRHSLYYYSKIINQSIIFVYFMKKREISTRYIKGLLTLLSFCFPSSIYITLYFTMSNVQSIYFLSVLLWSVAAANLIFFPIYKFSSLCLNFVISTAWPKINKDMKYGLCPESGLQSSR